MTPRVFVLFDSWDRDSSVGTYWTLGSIFTFVFSVVFMSDRFRPDYHEPALGGIALHSVFVGPVLDYLGHLFQLFLTVSRNT